MKDPNTAAGDRYVYFSQEMEILLKEYRHECVWQVENYENRKLPRMIMCSAETGTSFP